MNHLTEAEHFLARLNAMSRPQLLEAMRYLHDRDPAVMDRALDFAATDVTMPIPAPVPPDIDERVIEFMRARMNYGALTGTRHRDPLTVACPDCDAPAGERCLTEFGCMARYIAAQVPDVIAGDFGPTIVDGGAS